MWRKVIFVSLAVLLAYALGTLLHETWRSGHVIVTARHGLPPSDYSLAGDRGKFVFHFGVEVFGAICAVLMLVVLAFEKKPAGVPKE